MKEYFTDLFSYEVWANNVIFGCLISLEDPPEKALSIMSHIINAGDVWLCRLLGKDYDKGSVWKTLAKHEIPDALGNSSKGLIEYVKDLEEAEFSKNISYKNTKGENFTSSVHEILTHLTHHSAYHRGQVVLLIKPFVSELPYTDYIHYARNVRDK